MAPTPNEPCLVGDPFVLAHDGAWHMFYIYGTTWAPAGPGSVSDKITDLNRRERGILWVLCALMLWIGLAPKPWLAWFEPALRGLVR